jgi:hypothetical protein
MKHLKPSEDYQELFLAAKEGREDVHRPDFTGVPCPLCGEAVSPAMAWPDDNTYGDRPADDEYTCPHCSAGLRYTVPLFNSNGAGFAWDLDDAMKRQFLALINPPTIDGACDECDRRGWIMSHSCTHGFRVERCDNCAVLEFDEAAEETTDAYFHKIGVI